MKNKIVNGIIFDMDNTLLHSNINFGHMRSDVVSYLLSEKVLPSCFTLEGHTTSTAIAAARESSLYNEEIDRIVWEIVTRHELVGMKDSKIEIGVQSMLNSLRQNYVLTLLTNNSYEAAIDALERNGVTKYFNLIAGREQARDLKPSSSGITYILNNYPDIPAQNWLSVGDSWIDGAASQNAGVDFVLYQGSMDSLLEKGLKPILHITSFSELTSFLGV